MKFSDNLRNLRISRGLTQIQLAEALRTSQSSVTAWECETREPDFKTIEKIANYFNVPMSAILPSSDSVDKVLAAQVSEMMETNPKLKTLFDKVKYLSDTDLDTVIGVASALSSKSV